MIMEEQDYKKLIDMITETIYKEMKPKEEASNLSSIPVEVSNHHVHLTRDSKSLSSIN
ncbi:hypothetical protein ES705_46388 [subsurface metagenome]